MSSDDIVPAEYPGPYAWFPYSEISLQEFLTKYKPSMVQNDGTKPWLWVERCEPTQKSTDREAAKEEASKLLKELTEQVENITNDDSIPVRSNKKKGTKSKKELREAVQSEATEKLKEIAIRHDYVSGKWLIFSPPEKVDLIWSTIANSLISGPLALTSAHLAKVSTCPQNETPNYSHLLCLYIPNVYDKKDVTEVMKVLLRKHGMNLMGVKSDLYTIIGLYSKHPSGIPSTVWKNTAVLPDAEIKKLKDEFYTELNAAKAADVEKAASEKVPSGAAAKPKPKLKKKAVEDDPFASDEDGLKDDTVHIEKERSNATKGGSGSSPLRAQQKLKKAAAKDSFESDEEDENLGNEEEEKRKAEVAAKKAATREKIATSKRAKGDGDEEDEEEKLKIGDGTKKPTTEAPASTRINHDGDEDADERPSKRQARRTRK